jgi:ABC-type transporter Mla maintaining outer membrane lipid asymmetry permease subunit MlaE
LDAFWRCRARRNYRRFGALQFVVNLVAISFTRELGALITALAVSRRTASAIAAEVGKMVVTEEIDALRLMGLDPVARLLSSSQALATLRQIGWMSARSLRARRVLQASAVRTDHQLALMKQG